MQSRVTQLVMLLASLFVVLSVLFGAGWFLVKAMGDRPAPSPQPVTQGCVVTANGTSAFFTPEQMKWASVITAESIRRGLPARAATIALATAMQESSLRNLDHGDRDSVGLFQQRPSKGWGTVEQIMDPWYSSGTFYDHLVKVKNWQTDDVNDVAQKVQRSGVPEGYRKHVEAAKALASVLTGHTPAGITCAIRGAELEKSLHEQVLDKGLEGKAVAETEGKTITITAKSPTYAWAAAQLMMANVRDARVRGVSVDPAPGQGQTWTMESNTYATWSGTPSTKQTVVTITLA